VGTTFPGATGLSEVTIYDWPGADGCAGGSPHMHTASTEAYVVLEGSGRLETLNSDGFTSSPLEPGAVLWFTPGTVHRAINDSGNLRVLVVMQNAGLPENGDAVMTFPPEHLADAEAYGGPRPWRLRMPTPDWPRGRKRPAAVVTWRWKATLP
jgi:mannose-6-phosphate isomerase-like protein (cupin superfamily)